FDTYKIQPFGQRSFFMPQKNLFWTGVIIWVVPGAIQLSIQKFFGHFWVINPNPKPSWNPMF
ncbi:MAG: hypothetical protein J4F31_12355, partial [Flavobacteriales bacterium]|nr:hypothetical protein [Flavobacteriales bacterium]